MSFETKNNTLDVVKDFKKRCSVVVDKVSDTDSEHSISQVSFTNSFDLDKSESLDPIKQELVTKNYLAKQLEYMKNKLDTIEDSVEFQLANLKALSNAETEEIEEKIKRQLEGSDKPPDKKILPSCCGSNCILF